MHLRVIKFSLFEEYFPLNRDPTPSSKDKWSAPKGEYWRKVN